MSTDAVSEFQAAMDAAGLAGAEIVADGKLHRFTVDGDRRGSDNGWYILHADDRPAGQFGSWKTGQSETWTAKFERKLTNYERRDLDRTISVQRKQREEEEARVHAEAARRASQIWAESGPAPDDHGYARRKSVRPVGARITVEPIEFEKLRDPGTWTLDAGALVIPMRSSDRTLWSLQFIATSGDKVYLPGGRKQGCYFTIGKPDHRNTIAICEGFATGASIHAATDLPVAVAFDAGNLKSVALALRAKYANARFVICADNDCWKPPKNPGVEAATEAAEAIGAVVAIPRFSK